MGNNVLPNLSEWFEMPVGATIPANTLYAILYSDGHYTTKDNNPFRVAEAGRFFTEEPIEAVRETLEDVIREGVGGAHTPAEIAKAVEAFYAEQKPEKPRVIIDNDGAGEEWLLNSDGTYDWWRSHQEKFSGPYKGYTRKEISEEFGIKEERD